LRIHYFQHVPFEDLGSLKSTLLDLGHDLSCTRLYAGELLPHCDQFEALIVMGGPMGVYDEALYPWLADEKRLIQEAIRTGKHLLGICLGAQLIATVLGAAVTRNPQPEIGWFPLRLAAEFTRSRWGNFLNVDEPVFHWHGDTFALPEGALPIGSSDACANQGYIVGERIIGLQFHLETTPESALALISECADQLDDTNPYVQSAGIIMADPARFASINRAADTLVRQWLGGESAQ